MSTPPISRISMPAGDIPVGQAAWNRQRGSQMPYSRYTPFTPIDLPDRTVELAPGQGFVVSKGLRHRPRAPEKTVVLMVETAGIVPTGS